MDPLEPIHGVIGVDRALGLRVTVRKLPLMFLFGGHSQPQHKHKGKKSNSIQILFIVVVVVSWSSCYSNLVINVTLEFHV